MNATAHPVAAGDHVFLVDGSSFVFRAYFQSIRQDPKYNVRSDRLPTGAVRLFCAKMLQFVRDGAAGVRPTHLGIIFDKSENSFRKALYPAYKANRSEPPEDLAPQFPLMREAVRAFGLIAVEQDVYEADDLIATYARQAQARGANVLIISADKDLMQLVGNQIAMYDPASGDRDERLIDAAQAQAYFGVPAHRIGDVQALAGDATDNVPGARGVGLKTAAQLITEYGDLETLLARAGEIKQPKRRQALTDADSVALIRLSKRLVTLVEDVALETPLDALRLPPTDGARLVAFTKAMEFTALTRRAAETFSVEAAAIAPQADLLGAGAWRDKTGAALSTDALLQTAAGSTPPAPAAAFEAAPQPAVIAGGPAALAAARAAAPQPFDRSAYATIADLATLDAWISDAFACGEAAIDTETDSLDAMQAQLVGISIATAPGRAAYIPLRHVRENAGDLFGAQGLAPGQIDRDAALARLKPLLESPAVLKIAQNAKFDWLVLQQHGVTMGPLADTMLASYALDAGRMGHGMDELSEKLLGHKPLAFGAVAGQGKSFIGFARVSIQQATEYSAEDADVALRLWRLLQPRLVAEGMTTLYETLERPMIETLARMERRGVAIDRPILARLSGEFAQEMARLEAEIHTLAGERFNIGSPKQIGDILFGKMGLPGAKKTATGAWSTAAGVLEDLAEQGHPLPQRILDWRQISKLKSTYTDALPTFVNPATARVHTSYALAATTTGRLSSSEPNLQNIPVRNEAGRKIRRAFVAPPGRKIISADYSQIELRLLAHIADITQLKSAFAEGLDIHAMTASEMFAIPVEGMPADVRRRAKAINFGIIYGISAFGLANQLGIPREEAAAYIRKYFDRFPGIRAYMDATRKRAKDQGFVTTLFGRKCHYPRIGAANPAERAFNERAAINAPIQGAAADIIRRAMTRMEPALAAAGLSAQMLMQVHDELVFEAPDAEVEATIAVVRRVMETAHAPAVALSVPLQVDARAAQNWDEAH